MEKKKGRGAVFGHIQHEAVSWERPFEVRHRIANILSHVPFMFDTQRILLPY
jgi:hypothetical protein